MVVIGACGSCLKVTTEAESLQPRTLAGRLMANNGVPGMWRAAAVASLTLNVTLISAWFAFGTDVVTHDDLEKSLATLPYPWIADRGIVMGHVADPGVHENDSLKRARIQQELRSALAPLETRLDFITKELEKISRRLDDK